jgi:hypothetical protein
MKAIGEGLSGFSLKPGESLTGLFGCVARYWAFNQIRKRKMQVGLGFREPRHGQCQRR